MSLKLKAIFVESLALSAPRAKRSIADGEKVAGGDKDGGVISILDEDLPEGQRVEVNEMKFRYDLREKSAV